MHSEVEALLRVVPADHGADERVDWTLVERELGIGLPADYKSFMAVYGAGSLGDLAIFPPLPVDYPQWDPGSVSEQTGRLRELWAVEGGIPGVAEDPDCVLAWGAGCNANEVGWLMSGSDPAMWPTVVWRRHSTPRLAVFDCGMVAFIRRMLLAQFDECPFSDLTLWGRPAAFVHWAEEQRRWLAGLDPETGEPDPVVADFLQWPRP